MQLKNSWPGEYQFTIEDVEYVRHGDQPLLARLYRPEGEGPFPTVVELHGGVWHGNDRTRGVVHHECFARNGIAVAALDFRQGAGAYPNSLADINYGIRWVKRNADRLHSRSDRVAITGSSSGGHLAMLAAMRPFDPRYAAIELPGAPDAHTIGADVCCVVMFWPVINPYGRHQNARRLSEGSDPPHWTARMMKLGMQYWQHEQAMIEGSPLLALERGERVALPPALWIQGTNDLIHDYHDPNSGFAGTEAQRFVEQYSKAGGKAVLEYFDAPLHFTTEHPNMPASIAAMKATVAFIQEHARGGGPEVPWATNAPQLSPLTG
jgi:acetyl esterase